MLVRNCTYYNPVYVQFTYLIWLGNALLSLAKTSFWRSTAISEKKRLEDPSPTCSLRPACTRWDGALWGLLRAWGRALALCKLWWRLLMMVLLLSCADNSERARTCTLWKAGCFHRNCREVCSMIVSQQEALEFLIMECKSDHLRTNPLSP